MSGIAGSVTPLTFSGDVINGDFIVLQPTNCLNAHLATLTGQTMNKQTITSKTAYTDVFMTDYGVTLKACFATSESLGDSQDDYVDLSADIVQVCQTIC